MEGSNSSNSSQDGMDNLPCTDFSQPIFTAVTSVRVTMASISAFASVFVICLIVAFKKYTFFAQRLILYLSISVMLNGLARATQGLYPHYPDDEHTDNFCMIIGYMDEATVWMVFVSTLIIMFYIYTKAVHLKDWQWEKLYFIAIFVCPPIISLIPFIGWTYGRAGPWCWIRRINEDDCTDDVLGITFRYAMFYGPSYVVLIVLFILLVIMRIAIPQRKKTQLIMNYNPATIEHYNNLLKETKHLIWYPIILIIVQIPALINRVVEEVDNSGPVYPLWFLHATVFPLQGAFICIAYALDPDTRQTLRKCSLRRTMKPWMRKHSETVNYPIEIGCSDSLNRTTKLQIREIEESEFDNELNSHYNININ